MGWAVLPLPRPYMHKSRPTFTCIVVASFLSQHEERIYLIYMNSFCLYRFLTQDHLAMEHPSFVISVIFMSSLFVCFPWRCGPTRAMASSFLRFLDHTQRRITVGRTPLDEWAARRRDLYLTTHNTHNRQISMPPVGFEPTISAGERPQTCTLDRAATGTGNPLGGWSITGHKL